MLQKLLSLLAFAILSIRALDAADAPSPAETRLRETLRDTMLKLRTSETDRAALQAAQAESEQKLATSTAQIDLLTKRVAADKEASDKAIAELKATVDARDTEIVRLNQSLDEWKASQKKATALAATTETQRAALAAKVIVLDRQVADQQVKNAEMFKIGNEILTRYEKFGLGDALTAREPFVGITRVKFENLMQDFQDKLADERIKPTASKVPETKPSLPANKSAKAPVPKDSGSGQQARQ